jgi:hypothetical protein
VISRRKSGSKKRGFFWDTSLTHLQGTPHSRRVVIGRSVVHGQHSDARGVPVHFWAIAATRDRCTEAVIDWARILAYVTGMVDQELLARNEYLATENGILNDQLKGRLMLSDAERATLGEIGHRAG